MERNPSLVIVAKIGVLAYGATTQFEVVLARRFGPALACSHAALPAQSVLLCHLLRVTESG